MKSKLLVAALVIAYLFAYQHFGFWKGSLYGGDSWGYYIHLPSTLLYQDIGSYDQCAAARKPYNPNGKNPVEELHLSPIGKRVVKYPIGVAILEAPFFALAHAYCIATNTPADGFSAPYMFLVGISSLFYATWGIWLLLLALRPYFLNESVRILLGLAVGLATNLFYSATYTVGMSHPYLFFLYSLLLLGTVRFFDRPDWKRAVWVGASTGMIALTRSPEVICVLIPLFWGVNSWGDVSKRMNFFKTHSGKIALSVLAFVLILLPQSFYWKYISGEWWYNGYQGEHFDWAHPRILDGLFNYKNGWLIYTPIMYLALFGLFFLKDRTRDARLPVLLFLPLHWYIIYSWWCWNYINGFGSRPMIEVLPLLAFPLAALFSSIWGKWWLQLMGAAVVGFFIWLNLFQTWQVSQGLLLTEFNTRAYYFSIFGKSKSDAASAIAYHSNEIQPDMVRTGWSKMLHGERDTLVLIKQLAFNGMEDSTSQLFTNAVKKNGTYGFRCDDEYSPICYVEADTTQIKPGDYLKISVSSIIRANEMTYSHDQLALLVVHVFDPQGGTTLFSQLPPSSRTQNTQESLWFTGTPEIWGEASYFVKIPNEFKSDNRIKTYIWNPARQRIVVDDMKVEHWGYR